MLPTLHTFERAMPARHDAATRERLRLAEISTRVMRAVRAEARPPLPPTSLPAPATERARLLDDEVIGLD
ncbi:MAG: hypothetical protein EKK53_10575 [Burkholderiales bacterium]|nr:MAG: hypothetical protein EKK53_10575 [Burkholderiales bacterium]